MLPPHKTEQVINMKKLAIMAAASMMVAVSTAHAQFSYSGNTGTVKVTVTEECQIQVGDFSTTKPRSQLTNGAAIGQWCLLQHGTRELGWHYRGQSSGGPDIHADW